MICITYPCSYILYLLYVQRPIKKQQQQQHKERDTLDDYETDAGLDASPDEEEDESDDEHSDTDTDTDTETKTNSLLLHKSAPIMAYEKNLAKRWPQQKQRQLRPPTPPDTSH